MTVAIDPLALRAIASLELAILARLKEVADAGSLGFAWRTLATFPDDWEKHLEAKAVVACPGAWTVFAGWQGSELTSEGYLRVQGASFALVVADENQRPEEQYQRHGGENAEIEPGTYRLLMSAVLSLAGTTLGDRLDGPLEIGPVRPVAPSAAPGARRMSRLACELRCDFSVPIAGEADQAALEAFHTNWDIPPFDVPIAIDCDVGEPGRQLPDDAHADATDHLNVET